MPSSKGLFQLVVLLGLALAASPIPRGNSQISPAAAGSSICAEGPAGALPSAPIACGANTEGTPGESFNVAIVLNNTQWLSGYSVTLNWNHSIIQATTVVQGNWATGPCQAGSLIVACQAFTISNVTTLATGTLTVSQALLGSTTNVTSSSLVVVGFTFVAFSSSTVNSLTISVLLSGLINGVGPITLLPAPLVVNGNYFTPPAATAAFVKSGIKPGVKTLSISRSGNIQSLNALVANTGTRTAYVRADFTITGADGTVTFQSTPVSILAAGTSGSVSVSYTVPLIPLKYFASAILKVSGDGVLYLSEDTGTTSYSVHA